MKTTYYDLEITQKSDDNTFTISHSNLKKVKYSYNKKDKHVKATLTSFKGGRIVVEYTDVISVKKKKYKN